MMKRSGRLVQWQTLIAVVLSFGGCGTSDDIGDQAFTPLMRIKIHMQDRTTDLDRMADDFAMKKGLVLRRGSYPKDEREVDKFEIYAKGKGKTFFSFSNRRDPSVMEGAIYSNEAEAIWQVLWRQFLDCANAEFGKANVEVVTEH